MRNIRQAIQWLGSLVIILLVVALLGACGSTVQDTSNTGKTAETRASSANTGEATSNSETGATNNREPSSTAPHIFTDILGRKVEIPALPEKIVYYDGKTFGDILVLGVKPVGADGRYFKAGMTVYPERFEGIEDIGFPINLEKLIALQPDLIVMGVLRQESELEQLSKIAPTVVIDPDAPLQDRLLTLGKLIGKTDEAQKWVASYEQKAEQTWKTIGKSTNLKPTESATVFMYAYEKKFYVMGRGLTSTLYLPFGLKPQESVQKALLDQKEPFLEISHELLPEYAGDRVFLIISEDTSQAAKDLMNSALWKNIQAVKNGFVYEVESRLNLPDALTRDKLLDELPGIIDGK